MAGNPNVGPESVDAKPNHYREKTYIPTNPPKKMQGEKTNLPEATTRENTENEMSNATTEVKKRL